MVYEPLSDENQLEVLAMLMEWKMQNCDPEDIEKHDEICVSKNCVINYKELGLCRRCSACGRKDRRIFNR